MARTWLNDGKPMDDGRLCLVIDAEDGSEPMKIWGRGVDEVLDKAAKTIEHGARKISTLQQQMRSKPGGSEVVANGNGVPPPRKAPQSVTLSPDEQMQLTADLHNPSKSPAAVTRLFQAHTGLDVEELQRQKTIERIANIQWEWEKSHPEFPKHPVNYKLLNDAAALRVGYENITAEVMDSIYNELLAGNLLVPAEEGTSNPNEVPPGETPDRVLSVRPRGGAASYRRTSLRNPSVAPAPQPRYTREQVNAMTSNELRRKLETEPGFAEILATYNKPANANA